MNQRSLSGLRKNHFFSLTKKSKHLLLLSIFSFLLVLSGFAQNRPNINTINVDGTLTTTQEQEELAQAIHDFVDNNHWFVELHLTPLIHTTPGGNCFNNTSTNFLPWHRFFIGKVEEHLTSIGLSKYVPLPKWDPSTAIPTAFFNGPDAIASPITTHPGWNPLPPLVNQNITGTTLWTNVGSCNSGSVSSQNFYSNLPGNICNYATRDALGQAFGGSFGHHGNVHGAIGGTMGGSFHQAPGAMIFYLWHAYLDDEWKRWECGCVQGGISGTDLYMKDKNTDAVTPTMMHGLDEGYEPFVTSQPLYESEDIWIRLQNDGIANQVHENPDFSSINSNYVYVRVRNRGCQTSSGTEVLKLYFSKQSTGLNWNPTGGASDWVANGIYGDIIGTQVIPALAPGEITILVFPWFPPNPAAYTPPETESHVCLLARIETSPTPPFGMTTTETSTIWYNVVENNNIIWKNVKLVNTPINGLLRVGNPCNNPVRLNFSFAVPAHAQGNIYIDDADYSSEHPNIVDLGLQEMFTDNGIVTVNLGPDLFAKWDQGGRQGTEISTEYYTRIGEAGEVQQYPLQYLVGDAAPYTIAIMGPNATLENLDFGPLEKHNMHVQFHYLTQPTGFDREVFEYNIDQVATLGSGSGCDGLGGNHYSIRRPTCPKPDAGPDIEIGSGCEANLSVNPNDPSSTYTWFNNSTGDYIGSGANIKVSPIVTTTYEVQVVSPNGCVGYDLVTVVVNPSLTPCNWCFHDLQAYPNPPITGQLTVSMVTDQGTDINIKFMSVLGTIITDFNVSTTEGYNQYNINTSGLPSGVYKLHVNCINGPGSEIKTITIQ